MRYLIQKYFEKTTELNQIKNKIQNSWEQLFQTPQMSDIPLHETPTTTITAAIILEIICRTELTEEQINRIEKVSSSKLLNHTKLREIDLTDNNKKYYIFAYEFLCHNPQTPDVMESWLKD
ncbi:hypothetical protein [Methanobrevibacter sp.]|uniref:hypothetical protein n=1 Tax=Methanobrevibacter sp. TaxID=66852 RepID=UPI0038690D61